MKARGVKAVLVMALHLLVAGCKSSGSGEADLVRALGANLRRLEAAKEEWAYANKRSGAEKVSIGDLEPYLGTNNPVRNPVVGETYSVETVGSYVHAFLPEGRRLKSQPGPFTITSF